MQKTAWRHLAASKLTHGYGIHARPVVGALSRSFVILIAFFLVRAGTFVTRQAIPGIQLFTTTGSGSYILDMSMAETTDSAVLRYELGWEDVREVMATSRILVLMRRSWTVAGVMFAGLLAESVALLRTVVTRPAAYGPGQGALRGELIAAAGLCALLVGWSALRVWRLSPGHQARHALAAGVWQSGVHQYKLRDEGVAWKAPDGSAVFLPWSALTGVRETGRMFLLLDQGNQHVRGFIPKAGAGDLAPGTGLGDLIRARIAAGSS